jgi:putative membrane protein
MMNYKLAFAAAGMSALLAAPAMAAMSSTDRTFVQKAAAGGLAEVALGQLAQQNASSQTVKTFGQRMVTDHGQANQQLQQIAQSENIALPTALDSKDQALQKRLSALNGPAFDAAYTQHMVKDHEQDVAEFQREAQSGQDPALKAFAQKTLPILQQHLQMAQAASTQKSSAQR